MVYSVLSLEPCASAVEVVVRKTWSVMVNWHGDGELPCIMRWAWKRSRCLFHAGIGICVRRRLGANN